MKTSLGARNPAAPQAESKMRHLTGQTLRSVGVADDHAFEIVQEMQPTDQIDHINLSNALLENPVKYFSAEHGHYRQLIIPTAFPPAPKHT